MGIITGKILIIFAWKILFDYIKLNCTNYYQFNLNLVKNNEPMKLRKPICGTNMSHNFSIRNNKLEQVTILFYQPSVLIGFLTMVFIQHLIKVPFFLLFHFLHFYPIFISICLFQPCSNVLIGFNKWTIQNKPINRNVWSTIFTKKPIGSENPGKQDNIKDKKEWSATSSHK